MLGTMFYKGIAGITSMQAMTDEFNKDGVVKNLYRFMGGKEKEFLPHGVTVNEYFERLDPEELQKVQQKQVYGLIRSKAFYDARFRKRWLVIVDGTQTYSGSRKLHEGCLERHYKKGTEEETVNYHCDVLEAKIVLGEKLIVSIGSEFIENNGEDAERQKNMGEEERKQNCETKAFRRLAGKIKKAFPRLPVILLADSLYASDPVMDICRGSGWGFIIRYKSGSIPSIAEEYEKIPEKGEAGHAEKVVEAGRKRWKIENEGFNRQKNWQGDITHACSHHAEAMKNHYLMTQISDMVKQLYEWFVLEAEGIRKKQKNISSDLLKSFGEQKTEREDIRRNDTQSVPAD